MKKTVFFYLILLTHFSFAQNVFNGNITLSNQSQVNDFASEYYDEIDGSLSFSLNTSITDISGLYSLKKVTGNLTVNFNPQLSSLEGLNYLQEVGGNIKIYSNAILENLNGLQRLETIGGSLDIVNNILINNINGLNKLRSVAGYLRIDGNNSLTTLEGLNSLASIGIANAPASPGSPSSAISDASIIIVGNGLLEGCCFLNKIVNSATGVVNISNNAGGCNSISEVESSLNSCVLDIQYPREGDVYVAGRSIKLYFGVISVLTNQNFQYEYTIDNGTTWVDAEVNNTISTSQLNSFKAVDWISVTSITEPTNVQLRLRTNLNGSEIITHSGVFQIHPSNYYESSGFKDNGITELEFPFVGLLDTSLGWGQAFGSPGHKCLDLHSQDWNYLGGDCGLDIRSPIKGKVIFINKNSDSNDCTNSTSTGYGKQIVIQSLIDGTFAIRFAHLKELHPNIIQGKVIEIGEVIGQVGGTGTEFAHSHISLYKNIYEWPEFFSAETQQQFLPVIDLIRFGITFIDESVTNTCNSLASNFSAELDIETTYTQIISQINQCIISIQDLNQVILQQYTGLLLGLNIGECSVSGKNQKNRSSNNYTNIDGLETILSIDGDLIIKNTQLVNLDGLKNLTHVGGDVIIENNSSLLDFCGLYKLIENNGIGGSFIVNGNNINPTTQEILNNSSCQAVLSIENITENNNLIIYPNPTKGDINIIYPKEFGATKIVIYNSKGKRIFTSNKAISIINLSKYSKGIYYLKIISRRKIIVKKILMI